MGEFDICLCSGENCLCKEKCLRYILNLKASEPNYNTYFENSPILNDECSFFINND